jgi:hypothetical protein
VDGAIQLKITQVSVLLRNPTLPSRKMAGRRIDECLIWIENPSEVRFEVRR